MPKSQKGIPKEKRQGEGASQEYQNNWKKLRKSLAIVIKEAKEKAWTVLITTVDSDPWGKPYKMVMKRLRRPRPITELELTGGLENVVNALFPTGNPPTWVCPPNYSAVGQPEFSANEIVAAAHSLPNRKAPGPDGIMNELIKVAASCHPRRFQKALNRCWIEGCFPTSWKNGKLVLVPNLGKPLVSPSAFRPICLLNGCGKLLEKLLIARLRAHLVGEQAISDR